MNPYLPALPNSKLLQGAADEREWGLLSDTLRYQTWLDPEEDCWSDAARIYFDLHRSGRTVRSPIDCCIAQLALDNGLTLLHQDRDFDVISSVRPLSAIRFDQLAI